MKITVVALLCHSLATISEPVCREEIVTHEEMPMHACVFSQAAIAEWKDRTIFRGEQWTIAKIKCVPGDYVLKDAI
jgi:hypothetical protein